MKPHSFSFFPATLYVSPPFPSKVERSLILIIFVVPGENANSWSKDKLFIRVFDWVINIFFFGALVVGGGINLN